MLTDPRLYAYNLDSEQPYSILLLKTNYYLLPSYAYLVTLNTFDRWEACKLPRYGLLSSIRH